MSEAWRKIERHPCYEISDLGRLRRAVDAPGRFQGRLISLRPRKEDGYVLAGICEGGKKFAIYVHREVLIAFGPPQPSPLHDCAHDDGIRHHNHLANLLWATPKENESHKKAHGTYRVGASLPWAKLTDDKVREIRTRYAAGETQVSLAAEYGVRQTKISDAVNRKTWRHVA